MKLENDKMFTYDSAAPERGQTLWIEAKPRPVMVSLFCGAKDLIPVLIDNGLTVKFSTKRMT